MRYSTAASAQVLDEMLEHLRSRCNYVSLHFAVPDFASGAATEISFGGYARQRAWWTGIGNSIVSLRDPVAFTGLVPPVTVAAIGLNEERTGNNLVVAYVLDDLWVSGKTVFHVASGSLTLRLV